MRKVLEIIILVLASITVIVGGTYGLSLLSEKIRLEHTYTMDLVLMDKEIKIVEIKSDLPFVASRYVSQYWFITEQGPSRVTQEMYYNFEVGDIVTLDIYMPKEVAA